MKLQIEDLGNVGLIIEDWDITREFNPRTLTIDYSTWIAYISRKYVPAGIELTDNRYWKPFARIEQELALDYNNFKEKVEKDVARLTILVESFIQSSYSGVGLDNQFGDKDYVGVNQKTLTAAFNKIWSKLEDLTGEVMQGISMTVTPDYFISEEGCNVHVTATTANVNGIFEHISFFANGMLINEAENTDYFEFDTEITETTVIRCVAKIMGVEYERTKVVTHYNSFWLGAGTTYADIMDVSHVIPITNGMKGNYDITIGQGEHIIIVVGDSLRSGFARADMEGVEIPFVESSVIIDGNVYKVFTSVNTYNAGTYNIDINS